MIPPSRGLETGNRHTAGQWKGIMEGFGHEVEVSEVGGGFGGELLVVLHGVKSRGALVEYRERVPGGKVVLCLSGTDIYREQEGPLMASMREADRLVVLQEKALERVPEEFRGKTRVIVQGAERKFGRKVENDGDRFRVCVVGNLRGVKDPMRTAEAARLLPAASRVEVVQVGAILEEEYRGKVNKEMEENGRYQWLGMFSEEETRRLIAGSEVLVVSSLMEGGARVVGEAGGGGTLVLSSRIDGVVGLLGADYPGFFEVGDTEELARLLERVEGEEEFRAALRRGLERVVERFDPEKERVAWEELLGELG